MEDPDPEDVEAKTIKYKDPDPEDAEANTKSNYAKLAALAPSIPEIIPYISHDGTIRWISAWSSKIGCHFLHRWVERYVLSGELSKWDRRFNSIAAFILWFICNSSLDMGITLLIIRNMHLYHMEEWNAKLFGLSMGSLYVHDVLGMGVSDMQNAIAYNAYSTLSNEYKKRRPFEGAIAEWKSGNSIQPVLENAKRLHLYAMAFLHEEAERDPGGVASHLIQKKEDIFKLTLRGFLYHMPENTTQYIVDTMGLAHATSDAFQSGNVFHLAERCYHGVNQMTGFHKEGDTLEIFGIAEHIYNFLDKESYGYNHLTRSSESDSRFLNITTELVYKEIKYYHKTQIDKVSHFQKQAESSLPEQFNLALSTVFLFAMRKPLLRLWRRFRAPVQAGLSKLHALTLHSFLDTVQIIRRGMDSNQSAVVLHPTASDAPQGMKSPSGIHRQGKAPLWSTVPLPPPMGGSLSVHPPPARKAIPRLTSPSVTHPYPSTSTSTSPATPPSTTGRQAPLTPPPTTRRRARTPEEEDTGCDECVLREPDPKRVRRD